MAPHRELLRGRRGAAADPVTGKAFAHGSAVAADPVTVPTAGKPLGTTGYIATRLFDPGSSTWRPPV
jgi:hypothetical protein